MDNRIRQIKVRNGQLIPAQAEVWITVVPEHYTPTTEVRGRLMGPRCPYSNTVEVAYPLQTPPRGHTPPGTPELTMRVVIPEASLWEPQCPFLYQGPIELWQDGQHCDRITLSHGLRSLQLGKRDLLVNGRPLMLRGRYITSFSEEDGVRLHQAGCNLLLAPVEQNTLSLWEKADRLGFFMLGRVRDDSEETLRYLTMLSHHTSCLGWLIDEGRHPPLDLFPPHCLLGLACDSPPPRLPLRWVHFLLGSGELANLGMPLLVQGDATPSAMDGCLILGTIV